MPLTRQFSSLCFRFDSEVALPRLIFRDKASCFRLFCSVFKVQHNSGGDEENRTPDPLLARQVLSQLSYAPLFPSFVRCYFYLVGLSGLEPLTSRLSGVRSNQLSYRPL